jgi:hypothetical protein
MLPPFVALVLLAVWSVVYLKVDLVRVAVDDALAAAHLHLPRELQDYGSYVWHTLLPDWVLRQVLRPAWQDLVCLCVQRSCLPGQQTESNL